MNKAVHPAGWILLAGLALGVPAQVGSAQAAADAAKAPATTPRPAIVFTQLAPGAKWQAAQENPVASDGL